MTARILVVDDIAGNQRLLEAKLMAEYYEVALAGSGPEALDRARGWMPDIVLLDVMMPGMDGYEVCRRLKADPRTAHIPVVMVTALTDPAERVRGLEAGADDFLSKPVHDATLFARLRALLRVKQVMDAWRLRAETARDLGLDPPSGPSPSAAGARLLLLEENGERAGLLQAALAEEGALVTRERDAVGVRDRLEEGAWDLVLLSLPSVPEQALRLTSRLRAEAATREVPVLLLADPGQQALVLRGFELGANDHVLRPVDAGELRARVRNQIRRRRTQERLRAELDHSLEMAVTDHLTGLRNRRYARGHLEGVLRQAGAAVLLLDVDRFKAVNDTHGHAVGDVVLREVAACIRGELRAADLVARYGGEEFLVVVAGTPAEDAAAVAARLRQAIAAIRVEACGQVLAVTASIGLALAPPGSRAEDAVAAADAALYRAKRGGRDRVEMAVAGDWPAAAHATS